MTKKEFDKKFEQLQNEYSKPTDDIDGKQSFGIGFWAGVNLSSQLEPTIKPEIVRMDMCIENVGNYSILTKKLHINNEVPDNEIWIVYNNGKIEKFKI